VVTKQRYSNRVEYLIRLTPGTDERAPGAAVSVGLCGHWDHAGPCPWPHYSTIHPPARGGGQVMSRTAPSSLSRANYASNVIALREFADVIAQVNRPLRIDRVELAWPVEAEGGGTFLVLSNYPH